MLRAVDRRLAATLAKHLSIDLAMDTKQVQQLRSRPDTAVVFSARRGHAKHPPSGVALSDCTSDTTGVATGALLQNKTEETRNVRHLRAA